MTALTQRWKERRSSFQAVGELFEPDGYRVARIDYSAARKFVLAHHYSRSFPQIRFAFGLFDCEAPGDVSLVGVLTLGNGARAEALTSVFPTLVPYQETLELNRLVLLDQVPANAESWFTARALSQAAELGIRGVTTFSDPSGFWLPRIAGGPEFTCRGHVGIVYQALNMAYLGRNRPSSKTYLSDGTEISRRALAKVIGRESGADGVVARLVAHGATPPHADGANVDWRCWLEEALADAGAVRRRHPGNHKYALRIGRSRGERTRTVIALPDRRLPYPKPHSLNV